MWQRFNEAGSTAHIYWAASLIYVITRQLRFMTCTRMVLHVKYEHQVSGNNTPLSFCLQMPESLPTGSNDWCIWAFAGRVNVTDSSLWWIVQCSSFYYASFKHSPRTTSRINLEQWVWHTSNFPIPYQGEMTSHEESLKQEWSVEWDPPGARDKTAADFYQFGHWTHTHTSAPLCKARDSKLWLAFYTRNSNVDGAVENRAMARTPTQSDKHGSNKVMKLWTWSQGSKGIKTCSKRKIANFSWNTLHLNWHLLDLLSLQIFTNFRCQKLHTHDH